MLQRRWKYFWKRESREESLRLEMEAHIEEIAEGLMADGMSATDARAEARKRFGNTALRQEESREVWISRCWTDLVQDLHYAVRTLRRQPGLAAIAVLSSALGIGACSTVFGIVNFAMFGTLPVAEPERLMSVTGIYYKEGLAGASLSFPEIRDMREQTRSWENIAAFFPFLPAGFSDGGNPERYWGMLVTANYFDTVKPGFAAGSGFVAAEDDVVGATAKVVLSHALWRSRFGGDPQIVGRSIQINRRAFTVVGVTKAGFHGTEVAVPADFFLPLSQISEVAVMKTDTGQRESYTSQMMFGVGRLKAGMTPRQAQAELDVVAGGIRAKVPEFRDRGIYSERAGQLVQSARKLALPGFLLLLTVAFLVLLTACANVANLMLARATARTREIATRLAIGAGRGRLIRQLLTESILLALAGGIPGVLIAVWAGRSFGSFHIPLPIPLDLTVTTDYRVVLFTAALSMLTGIVFGLFPALRATRMDLMTSMRGDAGSIASLKRFGMRNVLVVAQVAVSAILLICSGLFLRSLEAAVAMDTGLNSTNVLLTRFDPALNRYTEARARQFMIDIQREAEAMAGVRSAGIVNMMPLSIGGSFTRALPEGMEFQSQGVRTAASSVSPRYFETVGIPILAGKDFAESGSSEPVVIVNQELAKKLYPGGNAMGRTVRVEKITSRIIGVVRNSKYRMVQESEVMPILYRPILDSYGTAWTAGGLTLLIKTAEDPSPLAGAVRQMLLARDPQLVVNAAGTLEAHVRESLFLSRLAAAMFGLCGGMGLVIASIGVYGVMSFAVARRSREIGIRMALGASASNVIGAVLRHGFAVALIGTVLGCGAGLGLAHVARSLIVGVSSRDAVTFSIVPVVLLAVAAVACWVPARRAAMVDPNRTLRAE